MNAVMETVRLYIAGEGTFTIQVLHSTDAGNTWTIVKPFEVIPDSLCELCGYPLMTDGESIECGNQLCGRMTEYLKEKLHGK